MLFTIDFYKRFRPETPEKKLVGIGQIATVVIVNNFVTNPTGFVSIIKYIVFAVFIIAAVVFWFVKKPKKESKESYV